MNNDDLKRIADATERIALVLGAMYVKNCEEDDLQSRVHLLSRCGFGNSEIASLLGSTPNSVSVALHHARKRTGKRKSKKA